MLRQLLLDAARGNGDALWVLVFVIFTVGTIAAAILAGF